MIYNRFINKEKNGIYAVRSEVRSQILFDLSSYPARYREKLFLILYSIHIPNGLALLLPLSLVRDLEITIR